MTRADIIDTFRVECPEFSSSRSLTNPQLHVWCKQADKEICAKTRCIVTDFTFNSVASTTVFTARHDLTAEESKFYDIDDASGGGVNFDNEPLEETSPAELNEEDAYWQERSAGLPEKYYRRGKWLYFDRPVSSTYASKTIRVYASLISDDFDDDNKTPFNQLGYLENFHYAIVLYLIKKAKAKGEKQAELKAIQEYNEFVKWMAKEVSGAKARPIQMTPSSAYQPQS